ncbi:MAG: tripartite tricarboxylate transporter permease [Trueperaceae bacterium]
MIDVAALLDAVGQLWSISNFLLIVTGVAVGIVVGVMPGLGAPLGIAIALPFTFYLDASGSFSLLLGIYSGATYGGSISAIVLGIPGTASAAATVVDGHPLFRKGSGNQALVLSLVGSVIGGLVSTVFLTLLAPVLASFALRFGPPEYFALGVFGVSVVGLISGESLLKGLIMGAVGIFLTTIGIDPVNGNVRFTFGSVDLYAGLPLIPLLVGLFALPEMLEKSETIVRREVPKLASRLKLPSFASLWTHKFNFLRSSLIGTVIGIIPAEGGAIGAFVSYGEAKRSSRKPEEFGHGSPEGVVAAETANNATVGGALVPTLTLGVPGSAAAAVLLGALLIQGLDPGPRLFVDAPELVYYIFVSLFVINLVMLFLGWVAIGSAIKLIKVPDQILIPIVLILAFVGSYATVGSLYGVWILLLVGLAGYVLKKFGFPLVPVVLGFVLGGMIERSFRHSLTIADGNLAIFITRPISLTIFLLMILALLAPAVSSWLARRRS